MNANFEDRVTRGLAQWVTYVQSDDSAGNLRIGLTHNPQAAITETLVEFTDVTKVMSDWEDQDDRCMESIIGAHEEVDEECLRYMFQTDQRELWIWTKRPATIHESDP